MKLNSYFVAVSLAFASSLVLARPIDSEYYSRDLADIEEFDARDMYDVYDAREYLDEKEDEEPDELLDVNIVSPCLCVLCGSLIPFY